MKIEIGLTPAMVTAALAILLLFFTVLKFLVSNEFRTFWAWIGLLLAIFVAVGAFMNMKELGHSLADMGNQMKAAAGSAAAAAKAATDKGDDDARRRARGSRRSRGSGCSRGSGGSRRLPSGCRAAEGEQPPAPPA